MWMAGSGRHAPEPSRRARDQDEGLAYQQLPGGEWFGIGPGASQAPGHRFVIRLCYPAAMSEERRILYPEIEPYRTSRLKVSPVHEIYFEESGNPDGKPVIFVHGGPGGGTGLVHLGRQHIQTGTGPGAHRPGGR